MGNHDMSEYLRRALELLWQGVPAQPVTDGVSGMDISACDAAQQGEQQ